MNPPRVQSADFIDGLIAIPKAVSAVDAAAGKPQRPGAPCHDAFTRLLHRLEWHLFSAGISRMEAKAAIFRDAVRCYLARPPIRLPTA